MPSRRLNGRNRWQGNYVKDLSKIDRDISQTIIVDNSPLSYMFQPENAIGCSSFIDDPSDRELDVIGAFLEDCKEVDVSQSQRINAHYPGGIPIHLVLLRAEFGLGSGADRCRCLCRMCGITANTGGTGAGRPVDTAATCGPVDLSPITSDQIKMAKKTAGTAPQ
jgi:hypothetical protein